MALNLEEKKKLFIEALKSTYKVQYDAIQPIPYIKDRLFCVDKVFVEVGVEANVSPVVTRGAGGSWERLESYKSIFTDFRLRSKRRIIQGEPGYGKSTLTLQLAYDWCNGVKDSPLRDVDILILLRLRQLGGIDSIYRAIKLFLLSKEPRIKVTDIKEIIQSCSSVKVALDGYDEYPDRDSNTENDVNMIIMMKRFENFDVTLTTRYLPRQLIETTKRARLTGFDDKAREEYIRKAVVGDNDEAVERIKQRLRENSILTDLCQVPLIFVMFAHMTHEKHDFQKFKSVTSFFHYMIDCFHGHLKDKSMNTNVNYLDQYKNEHSELDEIAFEGLYKENQQLTWDTNELRRRLGEEFYDQYIQIGILIEEEIVNDTSMEENWCTRVRFYHKLFCEWYASHYLARYVANPNHAVRPDLSVHPSRSVAQYTTSLTSSGHQRAAAGQQYGMLSPFRNVQSSSFESDLLNKLDPFDLQYLFRFACGHSQEAGRKIIDHLKNRPGTDKFAILCILEQTGDAANMMDTIRDLCSHDVRINGSDTALLQRSTTQLLEIASSNNIPIACLHLNQSYKECEEENIVLHSGLTLARLLTIEKIHIQTEEEEEEHNEHDEDEDYEEEDEYRDREQNKLTEDEVIKIFRYGLYSTTLKELLFVACLLPVSFSLRNIPTEMKSRQIKVSWRPFDCLFYLDLQFGHWEVDSIEYVQQMCSGIVSIKGSDSTLQQRSIIQLMQIASNHNIPVTCLHLNQSFNECDGNNIVLHSELTLTPLMTVEKIHIETEEKDSEYGEGESRKLTEDEVINIFRYGLYSQTLKEFSFDGCLLPLSFSVETIPAEMKSRQIKVYWRNYGYILNLQSGVWEVDDVNTIKRLCSKTVTIRNSDTQSLQACTIQLLDNASNYNIPMSCLYLVQSFSTIDTNNIILHSGLRLSCPSSVEVVDIDTEGGREMTETEFADILMFVQHSQTLKELRFVYCILPWSIPAEYIPASLKSRNVKVSWYLYSYDFDLNLQSGRWMNRDTGRLMTDTEYDNEVTKFRQLWSRTDWQKARVAAERK